MSRDFWSTYKNRLNQSGSNQKDRLVTNTQRVITDKFSNSPSVETVTINGVSQEVRITDENSLFKNPNKKRLLCKPDENINPGDLVVWDSENWLCTDVDDLEVYIRGIIEKCNNYLKYLDSTGDVVSISCIVTDRILMDAKENDYYILPDNKIWVIVDSNSDSTPIEVFQRFLLSGTAYKIEGVDNLTKPGLIVFKMCLDTIVQDDNEVLGIANYYSNLHTYSISILNGIDADITLGNSLQLELECKDNDTVVVSPVVTYSLITGSTGQITISSGGLISAIALGSGSVKAIYNSSVDTIGIDIVAGVVNNFTYALLANYEPSNEVKFNQTKIFTAHKYYSTGTEVTGSVFDFSVTLNTGSSSNNYLLTTSSDTTCTLKTLEYPFTVTLVASDDAIPANTVAKVISLKGLI
jgi:hypothetical protein